MAIRPKNWNTFQHYKNRRPPWIRLYHALVDNPDFWALRGEDAKYLIMIWLIASEEENGDLPKLADLAFRLRMPEKKAEQLVSRLQAWVTADATKMLATRKQLATPEESRGEAEAEAEGDASASAPPTLTPALPMADPDSGGELALAAWVLEEAGVPGEAPVIRIAAECIRLQAREGGALREAAGFIAHKAKEARSRGDTVNRFWFSDQRYRPQAVPMSRKQRQLEAAAANFSSE